MAWDQAPVQWSPPPAPRRGARLVTSILVAALVAAVAGVAIGHEAWKPASAPSSITLPPGSGGGSFGGTGSGSSGVPGNGAPSNSAAIAARVAPSLVDIDTTLGYLGDEAAGTGIVLSSDGEILTNNHVIDGETSIQVTDVGNNQTYAATVVGYDRSQDIAVVQLKGASKLRTAVIGDSSRLSRGQPVVAVGNAGGTGGAPSQAGGSITSLNQSITASDEGDGTTEQLSGLIESNADIQQGDSGGSLVNTAGQVIGVDTAASSGFSFTNGDTEGFSIPINKALAIAREIKAGDRSGTVHIGATAFLGVKVEPPQGASSGGFGSQGSTLPGGSAPSPGADIHQVVPGGAAARAGLAAGDLITSFAGRKVTSPTALTDILGGSYQPGQKVPVGYLDGAGQAKTVTVTLGSGPPD